MPALPDAPTFTEAGLPGFEMRVTYAVLAPAGTPRPAVDKLSNQFSRIVALPDLREKLAGQGMAPLYSTPISRRSRAARRRRVASIPPWQAPALYAATGLTAPPMLVRRVCF